MSPRLTDAQIDARVVVLRGIRESGHDQGCDCALCIAVALADRASRSSSGSGEREALLAEAVTLLTGPLTVLHRVHPTPFWICTCEAEADSDYPTGKPCTCSRPEAKSGCVDDCPACAAKRARNAFVERVRALSPQGDAT